MMLLIVVWTFYLAGGVNCRIDSVCNGDGNGNQTKGLYFSVIEYGEVVETFTEFSKYNIFVLLSNRFILPSVVALNKQNLTESYKTRYVNI